MKRTDEFAKELCGELKRHSKKNGMIARSVGRTPAMRFPILVFALLILAFTESTVLAADPPGFALWTAADLSARAKSLDSKVGPDFSARETLGSYGKHRVRLIHRVTGGAPEMHDNFVDVLIVVSGEGTLVVGGKMANVKTSNNGEYSGTGIEGGERHPIAVGDVVHIPAKTPHGVQVAIGKEITYIRIAIPAE
jgi:mannose-6-phosphate isomerase-like protein (cupin superfamily)